MKVPWTEHKTNEDGSDRKRNNGHRQKSTEVEEDRSRQKKWLGHILRHDSLQVLRITIERQIQGKKADGRPRTMLLD